MRVSSSNAGSTVRSVMALFGHGAPWCELRRVVVAHAVEAHLDARPLEAVRGQ
jgi:hypothetical protein